MPTRPDADPHPPPEELGATRTREGWAFSLPWNPTPPVTAALFLPLAPTTFFGLLWVESSGLGPWSGLCAVFGLIFGCLLGAAVVRGAIGVAFGTRVELSKTALRWGSEHYRGREIPMATADRELESIQSPRTGRVSRSRTEVLVLGTTRHRLDVSAESVAWLARSINRLRERTEEDDGAAARGVSRASPTSTDGSARS